LPEDAQACSVGGVGFEAPVGWVGGYDDCQALALDALDRGDYGGALGLGQGWVDGQADEVEAGGADVS
jgi:hypothetical protein